MAKIYALYKGEEYIADGTLDEIAEKTGLKKSSLKWMKAPSGKKKRSLHTEVRSSMERGN